MSDDDFIRRYLEVRESADVELAIHLNPSYQRTRRRMMVRIVLLTDNFDPDLTPRAFAHLDRNPGNALKVIERLLALSSPNSLAVRAEGRRRT